MADEDTHGRRRLPFSALFADPLDLPPGEAVDSMAALSRVVGRFGPTGHRDTVLIVTRADDQHADAVTAALVQRGLLVCRLNVETLETGGTFEIHLDSDGRVGGFVRLQSGDFSLAEMRSAWLRRPIFTLVGREWPSDPVASYARRETEWTLRGLFALLCDTWWLNSPQSLYSGSPKLAQLPVAAALGWTIPATLVTDDPERARFFLRDRDGQVVVKAFQGELGTGRHDHKVVYTRRLNGADADLLDLVRHAPCIFQEYVPKSVEIRVTIAGTRVFALEIEPEPDDESVADWRRPGLIDRPMHACTLSSECESACFRLLEHFGLHFGAIDLVRRPDGTHVFLELNTHADWLWAEAGTGLPITQAVADALEHCC